MDKDTHVLTPTMPTKRLVLRPLTKATQRQVDWLRDPVVMRYSEQRHRNHTLSTQNTYLRSLPGGSHIWSIGLGDSDRHIGNIAARADMPNQIADLGILIGDRDAWSKGYATEAFKAVTAWLLGKDDGGFRKIETGCMALNLPMCRVLHHAGFEFEGQRKNHFLCNGQLTSAVYYGKFR